MHRVFIFTLLPLPTSIILRSSSMDTAYLRNGWSMDSAWGAYQISNPYLQHKPPKKHLIKS
jgi:hypothetical protein